MGPVPGDDLGEVDTVGMTGHMDVGQDRGDVGRVFEQKTQSLVGIGLVDDPKTRVLERRHRVGPLHGVVLDDQDRAALHAGLGRLKKLG